MGASESNVRIPSDEQVLTRLSDMQEPAPRRTISSELEEDDAHDDREGCRHAHEVGDLLRQVQQDGAEEQPSLPCVAACEGEPFRPRVTS